MRRHDRRVRRCAPRTRRADQPRRQGGPVPRCADGADDVRPASDGSGLPRQPPRAADHADPPRRAGRGAGHRRLPGDAVHLGLHEADPGALHPRAAGREPARRRGGGRRELHVRQEGRRQRRPCCARPASGSASPSRACRWWPSTTRDETVTFSSTYIRSCVDAGDVVAAAEALGRPHRVEGVVVRGDGRGKVLGFPTANVAPPMYSAIPADGVYAAWFTVLGPRPGDGHRRARRAVSGGGVGRHQPDVLRAHPHRRGVRPRHRRRPVRPARRGRLRRPHPRPGEVRRRSTTWSSAMERRHRAARTILAAQ